MDSTFKFGDTDNNILRKILETLLENGGGIPDDPQAAGLFLASPAGAAGAPTFRAIELTDLPGGFGTGSVTSVGLTMPSGFSVAGSPVTTSGTLAVTLASQSASLVLASPTGSAGVPTFRAIVAGDLPIQQIFNAVSGLTFTAGLVASDVFPMLTAADLTARAATVSNIFEAVAALPSAVSVNLTDNILVVQAGLALKTTLQDVIDLTTSGTVTSVAMTVPTILSVSGSPITTSGTLAVTLATQTANTFFAGATSGGAATPTFRALVAADMPAGFGTTNGAEESIASAATTAIGGTTSDKVSITGTTTITSFGTVAAGVSRKGRFTGALTLTHNATSLIIPGGSNKTTAAGDRFEAVSLGSGNWVVYWYEPAAAAGGSGTVTSAAMTVPSILSVSGSPITTSGTFAVTLATQTANTVFAGATSGGAATPAFRALVAADMPAGFGTVNSAEESIASASTTAIGGTTSDKVSITGTTTITSFGTVAAGVLRRGRFTGALTLTHNATSLIIPGGANKTTAAGDRFEAVSLGSGNWVVYWYVTAAAAPAGTVTSVAMSVPSILSVSGSPVTTTGTLAVSLATQNANLVFAGATSGGAATPTFRALVTADLPAGTGTVTSAGLAMPAEFSVSDTPVTTTGTLTVTKATQTANTVWAGPTSGGAAEPAFRALVAADMPANFGTTNGAEETIASASTTAIGGTTSDKVSITGTTTITSFGTVAAGVTRKGRFTGILTLTHNATSLIIPGGSNKTTAAGDRFEAVSLGSGNWVVYWYEPATAAGGGSVTSVAMTVPSGFSVSGSPITTSGTLAVTLSSQSQKVFLASPSASSGAPTFRALIYGDVPEVFEFALSDETTAITTGTAKLTWRAPRALTVTAVRASLSTASSSGIPTVDINEGGTTILSTKLTIDANEKTSTTAATAAVISDSAIADDAEITFDIDVAGTGATGLKVKIYAI